MKIAFALVLLCVAAPLSAGERCTKGHAHRGEIARSQSIKPIPKRVEIQRPRRIVSLTPSQYSLLFEPQIL